MFHRFKTLNAIFNGLALLIMAVNMVVGSVWKESLAMVGLMALTTLVKGWSDFKKYSLKTDMCRFAYTTYEKTLIKLRNHAHVGVDEHQMNGFLIEIQTMDDTITDITPPSHESYCNDYTKKFHHNTTKEKDSDPNDESFHHAWEKMTHGRNDDPRNVRDLLLHLPQLV